AEHGVDPFGPIRHELGLVALPAVDPGSAVAGVGVQELLQQAGPQMQHRGADRQLRGFQALARGAQGASGPLGQLVYLRRELRLQLVAEPPFSSSVPAGGAAAAVSGGRASQMASLTSTIRSDTCANR